MARNGSAPTVTHMHDLAHAAGVSPATVSRVFNPATVHLVKAATRQRVVRLAQELGYTPNRSASALSSGITRSIALVFPHTTHFTESTFDVNVLTHTVATLQPAGFDVKVHFLPPRPGRVDISQLAAHLAVDGLIFAGIPRAYQLTQLTMPQAPRVVMLSSYKLAHVAAVDADNKAAGKRAADYFIACGHTALGMLTGPADSQNAIDRTAGFRAAVRSANLPQRNRWFAPCDYGIDDGEAAARKLLGRTARPTALFCASDEIALGALRAIRALGLDCPDDVSLIGFDNAQATAHTTPPLTTFAQNFDVMVPAAIELLLAQLNGGGGCARHTFAAQLIERASVARRT